MREVKAIAVYDPSDPWERSIQDSAKKVTGDWLPSYPCRAMANAIKSLKDDDDWLGNQDLIPIRTFYFFATHMIQNKETMVFVTHLLYLRDIVENQVISNALFDPVTFISPPLANFLFRDCPVHIYFNVDHLRHENKEADFLDVGGLLLAENKDIEITHEAIEDIKYFGDPAKEAIIEQIKQRCGLQLAKSASQEVAPDIFSIEEHYPDLLPGDEVWNKQLRSVWHIMEIEPTENGLVQLEGAEDERMEVMKQEFDKQFVIL